MPELTRHHVVDALRSDPAFTDATDAFLLAALIIEDGKMARQRGRTFGDWLSDMDSLLREQNS